MKAENGHEPKFEPEAKRHRSSFLQSTPQARRGSAVSERTINFFRARSKSDGVLPGPSFTPSDVPHNPGLPSVPRIEAVSDISSVNLSLMILLGSCPV
jgi:hypothetical protein